MSKQHTRRRRGVQPWAAPRGRGAAAALVASLGAGQALAGPRTSGSWSASRIAPGAASQADEQGKAENPPSRAAGTGPTRRFLPSPSRPWIPVPWLDADEQAAPAPPPPPGRPANLVVTAWPSPPCSWRLAPPRPGGSTAAPDPSRPPERPA